MSSAFWVGFFRDAGIPYSLAKSYANTFEENRIGKNMLLDLDKGILADMGIKVMGDVIGILKHAKKEARKDGAGAAVSGTGTGTGMKHIPKPSSAVHSTQSAPQAPAVSTTSSPRNTHSDEGFMGETELLEYQERRETELPLEEYNLQPVEQFDTLHSDLLMQQVVAAVVQQQQQEEQEAQQQDQQELVVVGRGGGGVEVEEDVGELGVRGEINPALIEDEFQEEYVTEAYKRQQQKRVLGTLYSDTVFVEPQAKQPRLVILPQEGGGGGGGEMVVEAGGAGEMQVLSMSPPSATSSRRMLEAAGLIKRGHIHVSPTEKTAVSSSISVFSRLDRKGNVSPPTAKTYPPPLSLAPSSSSTAVTTSMTPPTKRTILRTSSSSASPSPQKLGLRVTSMDGRRVMATSPGDINTNSRGGGEKVPTRKREPSGGGLVSSSSGLGGKEPVKSRLGLRASGSDRPGHHAPRGGGSDGVIGWSEGVSTSVVALGNRGNSGRISTRLVGGGEIQHEKLRRTRPTMIADSASSPQPKATARLGAAYKTTTAARSSSSTTTRASGNLLWSSNRKKPAASTSSPSMKADEYELKRQLDIRSRLAEKEKEVEERRRGPLRGRLGQHHVFQRLT